MQSEGDQWIPREIKIPVVSSLGIKAVVKIEDIDHTPFAEKEELQTFHRFYEGYQNLDLMGAREFPETCDPVQSSERGQPEQSFDQNQQDCSMFADEDEEPAKERVREAPVTKSQPPSLGQSAKQKSRPSRVSHRITPPHILVTKMQQSLRTEESPGGDRRIPLASARKQAGVSREGALRHEYSIIQ